MTHYPHGRRLPPYISRLGSSFTLLDPNPQEPLVLSFCPPLSFPSTYVFYQFFFPSMYYSFAQCWFYPSVYFTFINHFIPSILTSIASPVFLSRLISFFSLTNLHHSQHIGSHSSIHLSLKIISSLFNTALIFPSL